MFSTQQLESINNSLLTHATHAACDQHRVTGLLQHARKASEFKASGQQLHVWRRRSTE
jgi:hypothetical protein